jgi:hypothetical protein
LHTPTCPAESLLRAAALSIPTAEVINCYRVEVRVGDDNIMRCIYKCPKGIQLRFRTGPVCERFIIQDVVGPLE